MQPDQWLGLTSRNGELQVYVVVNDNRGSVCFRGRDLDDLKKHVDVAIAQRDAASSARPDAGPNRH